MAQNSPVTPDQIKATIASPSSSVCGNMVSTLLKLPILLYQIIAWIFNTDGTVSNNFIVQIVRTGDLIFSGGPLLTGDSERLLCDGTAVSRTTYADLFAVIGTIYGTGDGSTTFNLPDFRDNFPVGAGSTYTLAAKGGEATHKLTIPELPEHTHPLSQDTGTASGGNSNGPFLEPAAAGTTATGPTGGDGSAEPTSPATAHNNLPPYLAVFIYIKT